MLDPGEPGQGAKHCRYFARYRVHTLKGQKYSRLDGEKGGPLLSNTLHHFVPEKALMVGLKG